MLSDDDLVHAGVERSMHVIWGMGLLGGFAIGLAAATGGLGSASFVARYPVVVGAAGVLLQVVGIVAAYRALPAARTIVEHYEERQEVDDGGE